MERILTNQKISFIYGGSKSGDFPETFGKVEICAMLEMYACAFRLEGKKIRLHVIRLMNRCSVSHYIFL